MSAGQHYTAEELAEALRVFLETGSFRAAAAAIGRDRVGVAQALKRRVGSTQRQQVYARRLDSILEKTTSAQAVAVKVLRRDLVASDPKIAHSAAAQINDTARAASTARTAVAKLTGEHAPDKVNVSHDDIDARINELLGVARPPKTEP